MPNVLVHTLFAETTARHWRLRRNSPFDAADPRNRAAFVHGALGPDLGYFPRGDALISEVAHRLRTGRLAERLLSEARSDAEVAFACGWITHLLADTRIHPAVDAEAARIAEPGNAFAAASWNGSAESVDLAHVRVEVGLDGIFLARHPDLGIALPAVFDEAGLGFLDTALAAVYGPLTDTRSLASAHRAVSHWHRCLVPLIRWMTADWCPDGSGAARRVAPLLRHRDGGWVRYIGAGPVAAAFVSPHRPAPALIARVESELAGFGYAVDAVIRFPAALPDVDMEDGRYIREAAPKPATARTLAALEERVRERSAAHRLPPVRAA